jgi:hypothetical protein
MREMVLAVLVVDFHIWVHGLLVGVWVVRLWERGLLVGELLVMHRAAERTARRGDGACDIAR